MLMCLLFITFAAVGVYMIVTSEPPKNEMDADTAVAILQHLAMSLDRSERAAIEYAIQCIKDCEEGKNGTI